MGALLKILLGLLGVKAVDDAFGNRGLNYITTGKFESNYDRELRKYNEENVKNKNQSNTNTTTSSRGGFFGIGGDKKTTGEERRLGILSFLGDRSRKLDDAPDIVERNEQVLGGVDSYGGLLPPMTVVPNINNERILDLGFEGVRKEIEKINGNIDAIRSAMLQSALLESSYRDSMIESMRRDLVEKGKDRSDTRTERSIFNLLTRSKPQKSVSQNTKSLSDRLSGSLGMALGLNLANFGLDLFDDDTDPDPDPTGGGSGEGDDEPTPQVGDYYFVKDARGGKYYILQPSGNFRKTNVKPRTGTQFTKQEFTTITEEIKQKIKNINPADFEPAFFSDDVSNAEAKRIIELEDRGIYGDEARQIIEKENQENQKDLFDIRGLSNIEQVNKITNEGLAFNETFDVNLLETITPITDSFRPVEPGSGFFEFIDLRTFKGEGKKTPSKDGAATQLNNTIPKLNPSKSYSIFESFLKEHP